MVWLKVRTEFVGGPSDTKGLHTNFTMSRPVMRGFISTQFKKDSLIVTGLATIAVIAHRVISVDPAKQRYADFYKTYDPKEHFESMRQKGLLSCSVKKNPNILFNYLVNADEPLTSCSIHTRTSF
ncbi:unnamed protein product [Allacma fusca]|uniref:Mitochondrial cytochrome c oxidase subunit VIc/VIIs domain-containing protein n=1 Tax=Allacma fusca TaxID=39272 RepID=A0A8J2IWX9_9HEXA|nr:unnamed protein product [Allacma fusca]